MATPSNHKDLHALVGRQLQELGIPIHRHGYKQLCIAIPYYLENSTRSITKELYPYVAKQFGCIDYRSVERSIRYAIRFAWSHRTCDAWEHLFSQSEKAPSNTLFIATIAERIK